MYSPVTRVATSAHPFACCTRPGTLQWRGGGGIDWKELGENSGEQCHIDRRPPTAVLVVSTTYAFFEHSSKRRIKSNQQKGPTYQLSFKGADILLFHFTLTLFEKWPYRMNLDTPTAGQTLCEV